MHVNPDGTVTLTRDEAQVAWTAVSACIDLNILDRGSPENEANYDATIRMMDEFAGHLRS